MRHCQTVIASVGFTIVAMSQAIAAVTCSPSSTYTCLNGTTTFPGTYVGTVGLGAGNITQIGSLALNNTGTSSAVVNNTSNPSIYSFNWGGGTLLIQEELGNNGIGDAVDAELDTLASSTSTAPSAVLASINIPFTAGPSSEYTVYRGYLAAGFYAVDTYLAINNVTDPAYQINFTVPEPSSIALIVTGFAGMAWIRRRSPSRSPARSAHTIA